MAKNDLLDEYITGQILSEPLEEIVGERFGRYSKYIIQDRAIPDVRDGLKPVQRRILYAMGEMKLTSTSPFKKSARVCGEVMGKYHPHGDSSIYEALVRMSQDWKMGVPLIEMHGNNGSIDGDSSAAMRYTETRLSKNADFMLQDIDKNTVNFAPNYDDEEEEPTVLPAKFPNILVNGSTGISAGYATNIPPHNLAEIIDATVYLIDHENMTLEELCQIVKGPDFPTGGIVQGRLGIKEAFQTGRGKVIVRSKTEFEDMTKDGQKRIVVTEIPYEVNKAQLVKKIDQMKIDKVVEDIVEVRDESDRTGLRIAIDLKKNCNHEAILTYLFKNTDLQVSYNYNMVVISNRKPMTLGVIDMLKAYVLHQKEVITNRSNFELEKAKRRIHIVSGLIRMVDVLDEVIKEIRQSNGKADAKERIMKAFDFTEKQATAIVELQLYRLSNTDINALINEKGELEDKVNELEIILSNEKVLLKVIKKELLEIKDILATPRKTLVEDEVDDLKIDETHLITKEDVAVMVSKDGYIKRSSMKSYTSTPQAGLKEGDAIMYSGILNTLNTLLVFTTLGNYYFIPVYKISEFKWKDLGDHLSSIAPLDKNYNERVVGIIPVTEFSDEYNVLLASKNGLIKQVVLSNFEVQRYSSKTFKAMKLATGDEVVSVSITNNPLEIMVVTKKADVIRYRASEVAPTGPASAGIKAILLKDKDDVVSAFYTNNQEDVLFFTSRNYIKRMRVSDFKLYKRARSGEVAIKFIKANPHYIVCALPLSVKQYKEDVKLNLVYEKQNTCVNVKDFKYNVSDAGKQIENDYKDPYKMFLPERSNEPYIDGAYLAEFEPRQTTIFDSDFDNAPNEEISVSNILGDLNKILEQEKEKEEPSTIIVRKNKEEKKEEKELPKTIIYKKVSFFDEEE